MLNPGDAPFDRANLQPAVDATDRLAFPDASSVPVSELPFSSVSYGTDDTSYTTPVLLQTLAAVETATMTTTTESSEGTAMPTGSEGIMPVPTDAANKVATGGVLAVALAAMLFAL